MGALEVERRVVSGYLYRAVPQSPKLALIQLVTNQLIFYTLLASFVSIANAFHRRTLSLSLLWAAPALDESRGHDFPTKSLIGAYISTAICLGLFFPWTVEKSRKCADFAATVFSMHLIVATVFDKFPLKLSWWLWNVLACLACLLVGKKSCRYFETQDIQIRVSNRSPV